MTDMLGDPDAPMGRAPAPSVRGICSAVAERLAEGTNMMNRAVDEALKKFEDSMQWSEKATETEKMLVAGNLRGFATLLKMSLAGYDPVLAVREFHEVFGIPLGGSWKNDASRTRRRRLIREEFEEYMDAEVHDAPVETLDALVDMTYVIVGAALEYGMDFAGAFAEVHRSNMAKLGSDGKPVKRADGKVLKPDGWRPPDLSRFVERGADGGLRPRELR